ncbi:hypothetical protein QTP70_021806 [Hemibagrus guttatus]|uniref:Uncharacterized protein n=1 Tax=Hemibagrus guttatus TaxID=175788 RepID=A0AAE0UN08_9TELE|nr:hypothetical protein QTP70_021806 [Hemibagrus guttatus]
MRREEKRREEKRREEKRREEKRREEKGKREEKRREEKRREEKRREEKRREEKRREEKRREKKLIMEAELYIILNSLLQKRPFCALCRMDWAKPHDRSARRIKRLLPPSSRAASAQRVPTARACLSAVQAAR